MGNACCGVSEPNTKTHIIKVIGNKVTVEVMNKRYVRGDDPNAVEEVEALKAFFDEVAVGEKWDKATKEALRKKLWPEPVVEIEMKPTNLPSIDEVFEALATPMQQTISIRDDLQSAIDDTKQICRALAPGKRLISLRSALQVLKEAAMGNFDIDVQLDPPEVDLVIGKDCKGDVFDALKTMQHLTEVVIRVVKEMPEIAENIQTLVEKCGTLPDTVGDEATNAGLNPLEVVKAVQATTTNVVRASKFPQVIRDIIDLAKMVLGDLAAMKKL